MIDNPNERNITGEVLEAHAKSLGHSRYSRDYSNWLIGVLPMHDWPGRDLVDLDIMGDGSAWLHDAICGHEIELLSDSAAPYGASPQGPLGRDRNAVFFPERLDRIFG